MFKKVSDRVRACAYGMAKSAGDSGTDSPYINIPYYQTRMDPSDSQNLVQNGPPSVYNDLDPKDRLKNEEDIRRQGERPVVDVLDHSTLPVTVTVLEDAKTNTQGEPQDFVPARGMEELEDDLNRDTFPGAGPGGQLVR
jgi:hypothetical protein